jgi:heme-degrading monooxygenase HmoA
MIARLWSASASPAQSQAYLQHFSQAVLPELRKLKGFISHTVLTRSVASEVEIQVITIWQSLAAIDGFSYPDREAAVVAPEAATLLNHYDRRVRHFEVASSDGTFLGSLA